MIRQLYPKKVISSVYELDWESLSKKYQGVIFDIDNTIVPHGAPADNNAMRLFAKIHKLGMKTMVVSNNQEPRVKSFAEQVQTSYIFDAGKPRVTAYEKAMQQMGTNKNDTLFIGDQIFTDILGANRAGIDTMLTTPIDTSTDILKITIKRFLEKPFRRERS